MTHNYSVLHATGNKRTRSSLSLSFFLLKLTVNSTVTFLMDDKRFTEVHTQNGFINTQRCYKLFIVLDHPHTKFRDTKAAKIFPILHKYCNISITPTERQMRFIQTSAEILAASLHYF